MFAFTEKRGKYPFHLFERYDFFTDIRESCAGNLADGVTAAALLEAQELTNLIEGEPEILRALDEANSVNYGGRISPHAAGTMWDSQQTPALVIPYSLDPHLGRASEPPNGNGSIVGPRPESI
jgi:hypothetical protein